MKDLAVECPYCGLKAERVKGDIIYPHRRDLYEKYFYYCQPCNAYVGCHPGTITPLGRLANAELRKAKNAAHAAFDPLWTQSYMNRQQAYKWLAKKLKISRNECHIGMMDVDMCNRVIEICASNQSS